MKQRSNVSVPLLPGYTVHDVTKVNHHKSQTLTFGLGGAADALKPTLKIDFETIKPTSDPHHRYNKDNIPPTHDEREKMKMSARNTYRPTVAPAWLKHDRQVLRFYAYFQEPVHESPTENFRLRHCTIYFYLDDGTIMISEPRIDNSGIPQGTFVKRHRIPKCTGAFLSPDDLRCGKSITIYSRSFQIVDCDDFTEQFYQEALGVDVGVRQPLPLDSFRESQVKAAQFSARVEGAHKRDIVASKEYIELQNGANRRNVKLEQFLENDRKVLHFKCYWDDPSHYGLRHYYTMHYYLMDDTVELHENLCLNSGRDPFPTFYRRSYLRKNPYITHAPGMMEPDPIIYKPEDIQIGVAVNVLGREIVPYCCDEFTRDFYRKFFNYEQDHLEIVETKPVHTKLSPPPHVGFGEEEDSLASVLHLRPRQPWRDINKMMDYSDKSLRFKAYIDEFRREDANRRFIIDFHLADDTVSVWEVAQRNSGHLEGKFAQRSRMKNPANGTWYAPPDFYVGAVVEVNKTLFRLSRADESTYKYMEENDDKFSVSNVHAILSKLAPLRFEIGKHKDEIIEEDTLRTLLEESGVPLHEHEIITLCRVLCRSRSEDLDREEISYEKLLDLIPIADLEHDH